ncbi:MAG: hypothetical protein WC150_00960 [Bacteroidia bacterium]
MKILLIIMLLYNSEIYTEKVDSEISIKEFYKINSFIDTTTPDDSYFDSLRQKYPSSEFILSMTIMHIYNNSNNVKTDRLWEIINEVKWDTSNTFMLLAIGLVEEMSLDTLKAKEYYLRSINADNARINPWPKLELYRLKVDNGCIKDCFVELKNIIDMHPDFYSAKLEYGFYLYNEEKFKHSESYLLGIKEALNKKFEYHMLLGRVFLELEKLSSAEKSFRSALMIIDDAEAYAALGVLDHFYKKNYESAKRYYSKAVILDATNAHAHLYYGFIMFYEEKKYLESKEYIVNALKSNSSSEELWAFLVRMDIIYEKINVAKENLKLLELNVGTCKSYYLYQIAICSLENIPSDLYINLFKLKYPDQIDWLNAQLVSLGCTNEH